MVKCRINANVNRVKFGFKVDLKKERQVRGSLEHKAVFQPVLRLLHQTRHSRVKSCAGHFDHHRLEVAARGLLHRCKKKREKGKGMDRFYLCFFEPPLDALT